MINRASYVFLLIVSSFFLINGEFVTLLVHVTLFVIEGMVSSLLLLLWQFSFFILVPSIALATTAEKTKQDLERKGQIQEAISWYNRVLGFHIEGGHGNQCNYVPFILFSFSSLILLLTRSFSCRGKIHFQQHKYEKSKWRVFFHHSPCRWYLHL